MQNTSEVQPRASVRLGSVDALRGFAMFWILGADALGGALSGLQGGSLVQMLALQMQHATWEGFYFYDLIFPLFIFVVGIAIPLSLDAAKARNGTSQTVHRVLKRTALMYLLGIVYYGGFAEGVEQIRLLGVLQRLAICYAVASLLYLYVRPSIMAVITGGLLLGYWALLTFVPVPGFGAGDFARGHNLANWIDANYLPLKVWYGDYDPEGILSTLPSIASCLLGVFAGKFLADRSVTEMRKVVVLLVSGLGLIVVGHLWGLQFPVIKRIWTSSYVLVAGGWSAVLLALFYYIIDVRGWRTWAQPFVWIGMNALTIYLVSRFVDFGNLSARLVGGPIAAGLDALWPGAGGLLLALTGIGLCVLLCWFLYERKIFLRL